MFRLVKEIFIGFLICIVNASNYIWCVSLSDQKSMTKPNLINLHPNEYSQELHHYPFTIKLDK